MLNISIFNLILSYLIEIKYCLTVYKNKYLIIITVYENRTYNKNQFKNENNLKMPH